MRVVRASAILVLAFCVHERSAAGQQLSPLEPYLDGQSDTLAITNVTVVDVASGRTLRNQNVLIAGNRIVGVGATRLPRSARVLNGAGKFLIPGLWDMHTHAVMFGPTALKLYLANGITSIRDMGAEQFAVAKAWRDSIAAGRRLGPRMRIAGPIVENPRWLAAVRRMNAAAGVPFTLYERFGPSSPEEAIRWVDSVATLKPDHIKVRNWPNREIARALVDRARHHGLPVVAHANEPFPRTGVTTFEHGVWPPLNVSAAARDSLWRHFASTGTALVPTLVTWPIRRDPPDTAVAKLTSGRITGMQYVPVKTREKWRDDLLTLKQETPMDWTAIQAGEMRNVSEMHQAGMTLLAGSDIGAPLLVPGFSLHDELALLVDVAGMTPLQALQAATIAPARVAGAADTLGVIEVGKLADLVLLDADPLIDIRNTQRIHAVVANGRVLDRIAIDGMLADAAAAH